MQLHKIFKKQEEKKNKQLTKHKNSNVHIIQIERLSVEQIIILNSLKSMRVSKSLSLYLCVK